MKSMSFASCLDQTASELLARDNLPGAAVALIEDASPTLVKTWGYADRAARRAIDSSTLFNVASISKSFTSWGIMKLVEQGQVELDRPVEDYLGQWRLPSSPYDHDLITVRRLLSHTAGLNTEGIKGVDPSSPHYSTIDVLEGHLPALDERQQQYCLQWGIDPARDRDPVSVKFPPGESFHYSNMGFILLQLLIEEVSGKPFADFMQTGILDPLGMESASFAPPEPSAPRVATAHGSDGAPLPFYRHVALAAGGLFCSIDDLARFACAELKGGEGVISRQGLANLFERQCYAETLEGFDFDTALGHYRLEVGDLTFVNHTGGVLGWRSVYGVIPQSGHGFCALINSDGGNQFWMELIQAWFESI
jgi:CubicO group peptidase (beta-lactamase class C family)